MSETKNIYQKLAVIQEQILGLGKDKTAFGYKYVTGDKILKEIKPIMIEQGLLLKQEILSIDNEVVDHMTKDGQQKPLALDDDFLILQKNTKNKTENLTKVLMRFTWIDVATGEKDENLFGANGQNGFDKGVGSALTYAERYFLLKYFHIATDEDDIDQPDPNAEENKEPVKKTLSDAAFKKVMTKDDVYLKKIKIDCSLTEAQLNIINLKLKIQ